MPADVCLVGTAVLPNSLLHNARVLVRNGRIGQVTTESTATEGIPVIRVPSDHYIAPGFVDLHVHGGDGCDYMDGSAHAVRTANRAHLRRGTTTIFPTTTT